MFRTLFSSRRRISVLSAIIVALVAAMSAIYFFYFHLPPEGVDTFTGEYGLVLEDYEGKPIELSDFKRELLVVHAWASWCPYCGDELKNLVQLKDVYGDNVTILAVNRAESRAEATAFTDTLQLDTSKVHILLDRDDAFYKSIEGYAMPETIFINTRGEVIYHQRGPMRIDEVTEKINALIGE